MRLKLPLEVTISETIGLQNVTPNKIPRKPTGRGVPHKPANHRDYTLPSQSSGVPLHRDASSGTKQPIRSLRAHVLRQNNKKNREYESKSVEVIGNVFISFGRTKSLDTEV